MVFDVEILCEWQLKDLTVDEKKYMDCNLIYV